MFIGLGSMIGAGVFAAFSPAARAAGDGLLIGLALAAVVAFCNATSSAQLARIYPVSGGTYVYGRELLGPWWGFSAGWSFVVGKTASCAAMALTFAAYAVPVGWQKPVAIAVVIALTVVNSVGVTRTALLARVLVVIVLVALVTGIVVAASGGLPHLSGLAGSGLVSSGPYGVLQSAGLLFFAFAGYARIATMGEEVRDPARTIPRAITLALAITLVIYVAVAITLLGALTPGQIARSDQPLVLAIRVVGSSWVAPIIQIGAAVASAGALLGLIAGVGRTSLAMARNADLPTWLAGVHPRFGVPHRAELVLGVIVCVVILFADLRNAISFSSFGVLLYYFIANLSAFVQPRDQRRYPRALQLVGAGGCLVLVATLPVVGLIVGVVVVLLGFAYRAIVLRIRRSRGEGAVPPPAVP